MLLSVNTAVNIAVKTTDMTIIHIDSYLSRICLTFSHFYAYNITKEGVALATPSCIIKQSSITSSGKQSGRVPILIPTI